MKCNTEWDQIFTRPIRCLRLRLTAFSDLAENILVSWFSGAVTHIIFHHTSYGIYYKRALILVRRETIFRRPNKTNFNILWSFTKCLTFKFYRRREKETDFEARTHSALVSVNLIVARARVDTAVWNLTDVNVEWNCCKMTTVCLRLKRDYYSIFTNYKEWREFYWKLIWSITLSLIKTKYAVWLWLGSILCPWLGCSFVYFVIPRDQSQHSFCQFRQKNNIQLTFWHVWETV